MALGRKYGNNNFDPLLKHTKTGNWGPLEWVEVFWNGLGVKLNGLGSHGMAWGASAMGWDEI